MFMSISNGNLFVSEKVVHCEGVWTFFLTINNKLLMIHNNFAKIFYYENNVPHYEKKLSIFNCSTTIFTIQ